MANMIGRKKHMDFQTKDFYSMQKVAILFGIILYSIPHIKAQENLNLKAEEVFTINETSKKSSDKYDYLAYTTKLFDVDLTDNGKLIQSAAKVKGYRGPGESQAKFDGYSSIKIYNGNQWVSGKSYWKKTFTNDKYYGLHFDNAQTHAQNHVPEITSTANYVINTFRADKHKAIYIRKTNLDFIGKVTSEEHFGGRTFHVTEIKEGPDKTIYIFLVFQDDQRLALVRVRPNSSGNSFDVAFKKINYKPGDMKIYLYHIKGGDFYAVYTENRKTRANLIQSDQIDDASKEFIVPGNNIELATNYFIRVTHCDSDGTINGYARNSEKQEAFMFRFFPKTKKYEKKTLDYKTYKEVKWMDYADGKIAFILTPWRADGSAKELQIHVLNKQFEKIQSGTINYHASSEKTEHDLIQSGRAKINQKSRQAVVYTKGSYNNKKNQYLLIRY